MGLRSAIRQPGTVDRGNLQNKADMSMTKQHVGSLSIAGIVIALSATILAADDSSLPKQPPVSQQISQKDLDTRDQESLKGVRVVKPDITVQNAPQKPTQFPACEQSVLLGRSAFNGNGGNITHEYQPIEDGGFRITGNQAQFNRPICQRENRIWTGPAPIFRMDMAKGYTDGDCLPPLWNRTSNNGTVDLSMGTMRIGIPESGGTTSWFDTMPDVTATFRPGYNEYRISNTAGGWKASLTLAPTCDANGMICRIEFNKDMSLVWSYGGIWWLPSEKNSNVVTVTGNQVRITEPNLPNGLVLAGWDGEGTVRTNAASFGQQAEFRSSKPRRVYHLVANWGVTAYNEDRVRQIQALLDTKQTGPWAAKRDHLKKLWLDDFIAPALDPEARFNKLLAAPSAELDRTVARWNKRRAEFQIRTPDLYLTALINWERCRSEYHRQGPGLLLSKENWVSYAHISVGWYGKEWAGDHQALDECMYLYAAAQDDEGFLRWISTNLDPFLGENNNTFWVDHVWRHYEWTGDKKFITDLWPVARKAAVWMQRHNDKDNDGLFRDWYEYWNCDSGGKGPKAIAPSATSWAMFDRLAKMAAVVGDPKAQQEYAALADKTRTAIYRELWHDDVGRPGSIGMEGIWRPHPQAWEVFLPINAGLFSAEQARSSTRWIESHFGFEPNPGVKLLSCSDCWPIRWSTQWVPIGDTCLVALAGLKAGDADLWWPYIKTAARSAFRNSFPGIAFGISNHGSAGGEREDIDSVDPYIHVALRGLFGIEPALHERRIDICPAFPSDWKEASVRTPDIAYEYKRAGDQATFVIHTPKPVVKRVRANLFSAVSATPSEIESTVTVAVSPRPALPAPLPEKQRTVLWEQQPPPPPKTLSDEKRSRQVLIDLSKACNVTNEEFTELKFTFDYEEENEKAFTAGAQWWGDPPRPLHRWWGNPRLLMSPAPRVVTAVNGVRFLTGGRPVGAPAQPPKNILALTSWRPYPLPGMAQIPMNLKCERVWFLLQSYVHPTKNYIPNGEIIIHYEDGKQETTSLIPPYNLDCYYQHFSRQGFVVPLGELAKPEWPVCDQQFLLAHGDALNVATDPSRVLKSIELRATCCEGIIGLVGLTAIEVH
jgi:hypothetical protein